MYKSTYGDPVLTLRMPRTMRTGIRKLAAQRNTTVSAILRKIIDQELRAAGITTPGQPTEGSETA